VYLLFVVDHPPIVSNATVPSVILVQVPATTVCVFAPVFTDKLGATAALTALPTVEFTHFVPLYVSKFPAAGVVNVTSLNEAKAPPPLPDPPITRHMAVVRSYCNATELLAATTKSAPVPVIIWFAAVDEADLFANVKV
jgi:hypothetical protein